MINIAELLDEYYNNHMNCPDCGFHEYSMSNMAINSYSDALTDALIYKDISICICKKCNKKHNINERVNTEKIRNSKINNILN